MPIGAESHGTEQRVDAYFAADDGQRHKGGIEQGAAVRRILARAKRRDRLKRRPNLRPEAATLEDIGPLFEITGRPQIFNIAQQPEMIQTRTDTGVRAL